MQQRSTLALFSTAVALFGLLMGATGALLANLGAVAPQRGFVICFGGIALGGLIALVSGLIGFYTTRAAAQTGGRGLAFAGAGLGLAMLATVVINAQPGAGLPRINDITTDLENPPEFVAAPREPVNADEDFSYPEAFVPQVQAAYADLAPVNLGVPPDEAIRKARATAEALGWQIIEVDEVGGRLEARESSGLFRFVDDVVIRAQPRGTSGSVLDVRSRSRDGQGDLGVNARRIRAFVAALNEA
ncbi:MAG: DUF1499 domain-containing protein [Myxococcota bacterium]|nr:DUF1499 domain-containing protein [Myxococcota bacterium]